VIGVRLTIPIACWRKGHAREFLETEPLPPPSTCYGCLLSLVGEVDRERHRGARVTAGLFNSPAISPVLRSLWRIKQLEHGQGRGDNVKPDLQQLVLQADLLIVCDRGEEAGDETLEERVGRAFAEPHRVGRFGGWSLGESTHLVNDAWLITSGELPGPCTIFVQDPDGTMTVPVWVDHVGFSRTRWVTGRHAELSEFPSLAQVPVIG
jgi:CRISPR-associated protein Cas5t